LKKNHVKRTTIQKFSDCITDVAFFKIISYAMNGNATSNYMMPWPQYTAQFKFVVKIASNLKYNSCLTYHSAYTGSTVFEVKKIPTP